MPDPLHSQPSTRRRKTGREAGGRRLALARLHRLGALSLASTPLDDVYREMVDVAIEVADADFGNLQLLNPVTADLQIVAQRGFPSWWIDYWNGTTRGVGVCGGALEAKQRLVVEDVEHSPIFAVGQDLAMQRKAHVRAVQSTPLLTRSGRAVGILSTHYKECHRPGPAVLRLLDLLARQCADVIELAQTTMELRRSEERFRALATAGANAVYCMSPDWSEMRFLEGRGFIADTPSPSALWWERYIDPGDQSFIRQAIERAIRAKSMFDLVHRVRRVDGSLGWTHSRAVPLCDERGQIVEWFGAASDVTELRQAERRAFEEKQRLEALLRSLPVGVAFSDDLACTQVRGNAAMMALFGAQPADNLSASAPDRSALGRKVRYEHLGRELDTEDLPMQRAVREGRNVAPMELIVQLPTGRRLQLEVSGAPIRGEGGELIGGLAVTQDISERKQAMEDRRQVRLKDEFIALLGHELRNPLAVMSTALELLGGDPPGGQGVELVQLASRQVGVLRRLVDDLLEVSRTANGQMRLQRDAVDLAELLRMASVSVQATITQGQSLVVRPPAQPVSFRADATRMQQIVVNLLDNALKYSGAGGTVELSGGVEGEEVVIRCRDNGCGIAPGQQERIFEPLVRLESPGASATPGLGLGLTLVRRLVELHGGSVVADSDGPGAGSEFIVRLPWMHPEMGPAGGEPTAAQEPAAPPVLHAKRPQSIALVEDNPDVAGMLKRALERAGRRVTRFADGASMLAAAPALEADAVLMDIGLPDMDGYEVLARLREHAHLRTVRFIAVSGFPQRTAPVHRPADFDAYLEKPVELPRLLELLDQAVPRRGGEASMPRALVVEDHEALAALQADLLRREGFEVVVAATGQEGLEAAKQWPPQLVLCDMNLPDIKGTEIVRRLRADPSTSNVYAVVATAYSESELAVYQRRAPEMGVDEFVSKPITPEMIRGFLAHVSASHAAEAPSSGVSRP